MFYHKIIFVIAIIFSLVVHHIIFLSLTSSDTAKDTTDHVTEAQTPAVSMKIGDPLEVRKPEQPDTKLSAPSQLEKSMPSKIDSNAQEKIPPDKTLRKLIYRKNIIDGIIT